LTVGIKRKAAFFGVHFPLICLNREENIAARCQIKSIAGIDDCSFAEILILPVILRKINRNPAKTGCLRRLHQIRRKNGIILFVTAGIHVGHIVGNDIHLLPQGHLARKSYVFGIIHKFILPNKNG
jgi:hypothetical protein